MKSILKKAETEFRQYRRQMATDVKSRRQSIRSSKFDAVTYRAVLGLLG
jgi:hypothetical protein